MSPSSLVNSLNIGQMRLNTIPNDSKFDAEHENRYPNPREDNFWIGWTFSDGQFSRPTQHQLSETGGGGSKKTSHHKISRKVVRMAWEMKATKTSVMLLIVYLLCWAPLGILYMIDHICRNCISNDPGSETHRSVVKVISLASSLLLPLVYCWRTKEFRHELANFLWRKRSESRTSYRSENLM